MSYMIDLPNGGHLEIHKDRDWWAGDVTTPSGWHRQTIWRDTEQEVEDAAILLDLRGW